jgi:hypothetical protein
MIRASVPVVLALSGLLLAGCQTGPSSGGMQRAAATPMDGSWASTDGVFVANFQEGNFTSRFTRTNEVLAQGTYTVSGSQISMQWLSVATQQQRSASCTMSGSDTVRCEQAGGGGFELQRAA